MDCALDHWLKPSASVLRALYRNTPLLRSIGASASMRRGFPLTTTCSPLRSRGSALWAKLAGSLPAYVDKLQTYMTKLHARHPAIPEGSRVMEYLAETGSQVLSNAFTMTGKLQWRRKSSTSCLELGTVHAG